MPSAALETARDIAPDVEGERIGEGFCGEVRRPIRHDHGVAQRMISSAAVRGTSGLLAVIGESVAGVAFQ
ncbi:hypothetical protein [Nocardia otitidiscaviarum]|uniref:hypothetical protein n=1 Tax=Nocardia otitidiscaviarum TaxID=1823 RepID=UPI001895548D|nr:hypothetical protein [Nocardia otitidiscaviarum]MBF6177836.1 hypothetical protein [Nocardia otitidiscaviarum]